MEHNEINIDELERMAKAATSGPWHSPGMGEVHDDEFNCVIVDVCWREVNIDGSPVPLDASVGNGTQEDANFIAAANPAVVLSLIGRLRKAEAERDEAKMRVQILERNLRDAEEAGRRLAKQAYQAEQEAEHLLNACSQPQLSVCFGFMYESSGKTNWTAILHRRDDPIWKGITIERSECKDRVRYEADRVRWLIGELKDEPDIVEYKGDLTEQVLAEPVNARLLEAAKAALDAMTCSGEADDPGHRCGHCDDYVDRNGVVRAALRDALASAEAQQADSMQLTRESVARAIWGVRREYEDRCDMELEDMGDSHPVWDEADAVLAIAERVQSGVAWLTTEQARNAERYAYLRSQHEGSVAASFAVFAPEQPIGEFGPVGSMPGELDAAIDSAMRADSHKVEG